MPKIRVLVVDDAVVIRRMLTEVVERDPQLELAGIAANGRIALQKIPQVNPDIITLDIEMPDMDGITALGKMREMKKDLPVIMMSGHATIDTAVQATRIGAHSFLEKPITLQKLLKAVEQALAKDNGGKSARQPTAALSGGLHARSGPDLGDGSPNTPQELQPSRYFDLDKPLRDARDEFEKAYFEFHLAKESGSMTRVAEKTGLERTHLYRKLKQLGVDLSRGKRG